VRFTETKVAGAFLIEPEPIGDERGLFARTFCREEFEAHGLDPVVAQCNFSFNHRRGTLRGLHHQAAPHQEAKLVRCTRGAIWDVAVDLRPGSPTYRAWFGAELSDGNRAALYIPQGCAHGFLSLTDAAEVAYQMSAPYAPGAARGVRWDDPAFGIEWPGEVLVINQRDASYPDVEP
jgi:dTDP-4-dehydrorhamnose 3,5-epimerase